MIGVVLDTAVVICGLGQPEAAGGRVMKAAIAGSFVPITTPRLLDELARALRRREIRGAFPRPGRIVSLLGEMSMVITPNETVQVVPDEAMNHLLSAARASDAAYLATWSIDLLALHRFERTRIVRPA